jgi:hypothetical protein
MPLIKVYNIDSDLYGLKGHSIFKSVCNAEASWRGTFGHLIQTASAESRFFLEDLRRRSIDPTTVIQSARYQQTLRRYHDKTIRHRSFAVGDLVLRRILMGEGRHKLSPLWEGPFMVAEVTRPGSYRLTQMDGTEIGNSWNIEHLRKFYP